MEATAAAAIRRINESQAQLNAFTFVESPDGIADSTQTGPLAGVPVGLKDLIGQRGRVTTCGSAFYRDEPAADSTAVSRLRGAGGVIVGRTGLHEFAFGFSSENPHFGPVRNPWDTSTSPGGSSGGSGAAVGAGLVPIAIGTDTGGSVRVPAALCGCYGLKVTHGAVPLDGVFPLVPSIDTVGPLADSMGNLETAYRVLAEDARPAVDAVGLRFGIPQPWYEEAPMSGEVASAFSDVVESLKELGHEVHQIQIPDVLPDQRVVFAIAGEVKDVHREFRAAGCEYGAEVAERLDGIFEVSRADEEVGRQWQLMVRDRFADAFATVDLLITPTVPAMHKTIGQEMIGGSHYRKVLSWFTSIVNHALAPAIAMPLAGTGSPPVSLQVIGPAGSENALLGLGHSLDAEGLTGFETAPNFAFST